MLFIIAHHYVVNSGLTDELGPIWENPWTLRAQLMLQIGAWGKTGINCFVLITGYFMCTSHISAVKFLKLIAEILFYNIIFGIVFCVAGYSTFNIAYIVEQVNPIPYITTDFTSAFLVFYLCIPFINILLAHLSEKEHIRLIILCLFIYVLPRMLPLLYVNFNFVSWFTVLYVISAYVRLYPKKIFKNRKLWGTALFCTMLASSASVILFTRIGMKENVFFPYDGVTDSNNFLPLITAFSAFMFFKNLHIQKSRLINTVSATTFGVLLIHANSDAMRQWLWRDILHNVEAFSKPWVFLHTVCSVAAVFTVCSLIDLIRIKWIETPFFAFVQGKISRLTEKTREIEGKLVEKIENLS